MAVKFSEFTEETVASNITGIVGYVASSNLNVRIAPGALNTSYDLTATDNAANNVPLVLTGSDSTADTVNFVGAGGIQLSSTGNVVTVTSDARVDSFTSSFGNYISGTNQVDATGSVSIGSVNLSAIDGTSDSTTRFLSKDNTWDLVDRGVTGSGTANIVPLWTDTTVLGDSVIAQSGTNNVLVGGANDYSRISVTNGSSARTGITLSDGNTASLMLFAGNTADAVIGIDTQNLVFKTGANAGQDNGTERMRIASTGQVKFNAYTSASAFTGTAVANLAVDSNGDIITEAAGGGSSLPTITVNTGAGTGAQTVYPLSVTPSSVNYVNVFINGVYQAKSSYSVSGTNLTFATAPPNNSVIEFVTTT